MEKGGTAGSPIIDAIAGVPLTQNKISARNVLCTPPSTRARKRTPIGRRGWAAHRRRFTLESLLRCSQPRPYSYRSLRLQPLASLSHSYTQTPLEGPGTRGEYRIMTPEGLRKKRRTREWNDTREKAKVRDERAKKTEKNRDER